jgi:streptogramin lyase
MNRVLYGVPHKKMELRTMLMGTYKDDEALYVADASGKTENILVFGQCSYWSKMRTHITSTMGGRSIYKEGAQHSYGLSFDNDGNLYVSYQHTNAILRSQKDTFQPMALPQAMQNREGEEGLTFFEGTFYQFGEPKVQDQSRQGVRSIAWAVNNEYGELLWVVNEFENAIYIMDKAANVVRTIAVPAPIGLYHDKEGGDEFTKGRIYVGSRAKKTGSVMVFDTSTFEQVESFVYLTMSHPTGISVHDGVLYVADQSMNAILTFDLESSRFLKIIWERPDSNIEQLALSSC